MTHPLPPMPRQVGAVNWVGLWTLYAREVRRFLKVHQQTVWAPVVTTLLFYAVFALALGGAVRMIGTVPYLEFLAPGLIMMAMAQNAFANTSSSVVIAKVQGNIVDILMPPMAPLELAFGFVMGGVTRGLLVGLVTGLAIWAFVPVRIAHPEFVIFHALMASMLLSLLGLVGGIWSEKFDNIAAVTNFVVTPLSFLSGTFYSVETLPPVFWWIAHFDPFFYMIDGFRYGFIGRSDGTLGIGILVMLAVNGALWWLAWRMLKTGYKLKA
ncbi:MULTISPECIES: ABC transporter permease [Azospirillum]|uniref:Transport permease protein n=2 Tax=Azospirillum TaxID=191 RepID=A0A4D8PK15_9PROT|nr:MULTISPECIES: ABC transporter permease [Azospirillum]MBY3754734.1 ABC transporter permease [Azospirillum formosense]NUB22692.1 multidrug ABC transporter permease [Azospirillum formosense]QCN97550.1 multidrug ABC transporter permease [Azospirillum argentinense]